MVTGLWFNYARCEKHQPNINVPRAQQNKHPMMKQPNNRVEPDAVKRYAVPCPTAPLAIVVAVAGIVGGRRQAL